MIQWKLFFHLTQFFCLLVRSTFRFMCIFVVFVVLLGSFVQYTIKKFKHYKRRRIRRINSNTHNSLCSIVYLEIVENVCRCCSSSKSKDLIMHHCIPGRKLYPPNARIYQGVIVTQPIAGDIVHYVFRDKDSHLFRMPLNLFRCFNPSLRNTERIRREQLLEFGDNIDFTCDEETYVVIDYEKTIKTLETKFIDEMHLLKTICVLSPNYKSNRLCWTKMFGTVELDINNVVAFPNISLHGWFSISIGELLFSYGNVYFHLTTKKGVIKPFLDLDTLHLVSKFHSFERVAQEERLMAWDADWNITNRPVSSLKLDEPDDDEDDFVDEFVEKNEEEVLGIKSRLQGIVISDCEIFCPSLPNQRVFVGLWDSLHLRSHLQGHKVIFDAFYSDICAAYIVYYYKIITQKAICDIIDAGNDTLSQINVNVQLHDYNMGGLLYHSYFGLIADSQRRLCALPYIDSKLEHINANIVDQGPKNFPRFHIKAVTNETNYLIERANKKLACEQVVGDGFVIDQTIGLVHFYKYSNAQFFLSKESHSFYPNGTWITFKAVYQPKYNNFAIISHKIMYEKQSIDCAPSSSNSTEYEFKIEVEHHRQLKELLFNRLYGFIDDPNHRFSPTIKLSKYDVIVERNTSPLAVTIFRLKRMAKSNEQLAKKNNPRVGKIIDLFDDTREDNECETTHITSATGRLESNNSYRSDEDDDDSNEIQDILGLPGIYTKEHGIENCSKPTNVEFNSKYSIRERKVEARQRKLEREQEVLGLSDLNLNWS